jgi:uncharacterized protein (TIGR04255 family)
MVSRPADLPDYKRPPLVEVVLGVQFAQLQGYRTVHAGLLWEEKFRKVYPRFVEQPPLGSTFEVFGPQARAAQFEITSMPGPPVPRLWFMNSEETELVQMQADRFVRNWRGEGEHYPRYEQLREQFLTELEEVDAFCKNWDIGSIQPNQCEITYVNRLRLEGHDLRTVPGLALKIFERQGMQLGDESLGLPEPEHCNMSLRYILKNTHGQPRGRLLITVQPWPREPELRLDLTVRGAPAKADFEAVAEFLNEGRRTIVQGFTSITREEMHKQWGRVK